MKMHNPLHLGEVIKELCLEPLNMTVIEFAQRGDYLYETQIHILNCVNL